MDTVNYYSEIGQTLKELRLKKNMSRRELADGICSVSYITRIENGDRCPSSVILRQITTRLGVAPDDLFRAIESPSGLKIKNTVDQLFYYLERNEYKNMAALIAEEENNLQICSIHDLQIIGSLKVFCNSILEEQYESGVKELKESLYSTYIDDTNPTDVEFAIMSGIAFLLILDKKNKDAHEQLMILNKYIDAINFIHSKEMLPRYYVYLTIASMDHMPIRDLFNEIEAAIDYCKKHNVHSILRELYALKGEIYLKAGDEENYRIWIDNALTLHKLIKYSDEDYFETFLENRRIHNKKALSELSI